MSLQVWLPLNGTTKNCGISDATASLINNPQVVASNRGECYNLNPNNENNQAIEVTFSNMPNLIKKEFSIAFWIYHRDNSDRSIIFGNHQYNGNYTFNIEKLANNQLRIYMQAQPDISFSTCTIDANTWTHITIVKNTTELCVYKNGVKVATRSHISSDLWQYADGIKYLLGRDIRTDNTALNGMLSDFRIYDHILSQKEINSLAQGLILNYSFNDVYMSATTNLVNMADGTFVKNANSVWYAGLQCASTYVTPGKTYTFSCDIRHSGTKAYTVYFDTNCTDDGGVYNGNDAAMQDIKSNTGIIIPNNGTWVRAWVTVTIKPDAGNPYIHHTLCPSVSAEEVTFYYRNVQLEEGPTATPYTPYGNPREGVINDVSGWGRHGKLRTSKCYVSSDTILGNCSLLLDGSDNVDRAHVFADLNLNDIKNYTFASFIKVNKWGIQDSGLISADFNSSLHPIDYYRSPIHHRDGGFDISVIGNNSDSISATHQILNCSSSDIPIGKWTHIAVTFNGTMATLYINGVSKRNISFGSPVTLCACKYLFLSYSCAGGAHRVTKANWSDFRVYTTALDAAAIKKLSERRAAVDKNNNFYAYSLLEDSAAGQNINKAGNLTVKELQEINKAAIHKNYFEANNFYEN